MARVALEIGGNSWKVDCRDGEEEQVRALGRMLDERWPQAQRAAGEAGAFRIMLLIALMLADDLNDATANAPPPGDYAASHDATLAEIADRLEKLADALERDGASD